LLQELCPVLVSGKMSQTVIISSSGVPFANSQCTARFTLVPVPATLAGSSSSSGQAK